MHQQSPAPVEAEAPPSASSASSSPPPPAAADAPMAAPDARQHQRAISAAYFGPSSQATELFFASDDEHADPHAFYQRQSSSESRDADAPSTSSACVEALASQRRRRKENQLKFKQIAQLADAHRPVDLHAFTRKSSKKLIAPDSNRSAVSHADRVLNTELLEAYVAYARSIGREPQIDFSSVGASGESDQDVADIVTGRASFIQQRRPVVEELTHWWTESIGTRHSKRRGCVQFWAWLFIGVAVAVVMAFFLAHLSLNEVLHLDAFVEENVVLTDDFTFLYLRDEVTFRIRYDIAADLSAAGGGGNSSFFQVLLLYEDDFEAYVEGKPFRYIPEGSTLRTTYASLPLTEIVNDEYEEVYFVVQPCVLARNPGVDYCQTRQLPTPVSSGRKVYKLKDRTQPAAPGAVTNLAIRRLYVNPMPNNCSASGWKGGSYFLIFLPFVLLSLFGLRVFQMLFRCESFRANLERKYKSEFAVPENEVDYWQPMPWDRKVPKTRLLGPCCWKKIRRPFEPFYTWWRHENYFTWIFFPYRNERLSRGERAIIVFCSLYLTFYVLFVLVMLRDSLGAGLSLAASVLIYYVLIMILPTLGKAIFKEIFKLIFRQRRKYFRVKAAGGDTAAGFSFRFAFFLQVLATLLIAVTQLPMFYIWMYRSCTFLKQFMYFGLLAAVTRLSVLGLSLDYVWYVVIKTWGWRDLCPYCTERLVHCECFNDELLVLSVERVGPKWELIMLLDRVLAKKEGYTSQFDQYTPEQLRERWQILVERAEVHMGKVEKLRAYQEKRRVEQLRRQRQRESFLNAASFLGFSRDPARSSRDLDAGAAGVDAVRTAKSAAPDSNTEADEQSDDVERAVAAQAGCCLREKKVLAVNSRIMLDRFEKHYDSSIVGVFHSIQRSLSRRRRHARREWRRRRALRRGDVAPDEAFDSDASDASDDDGRRRRESASDGGRGRSGSADSTTSETHGGDSSSGSSGGETMWVFDSPQQRLERRELEKKRRKRAFRVLDDYFIETVEPERDAQGNVHFVSTSDQVAPGAAAAAAAAGATPSGESGASRANPSKALVRRDSKYVQLLTRKKSMPRNEDVVVVVSETADAALAHVAVVEEEGESDSDREGVGARFSGSRSSRNSRRVSSSFREAGAAPPPSSSRAYAVMEKKPSILRQVSSSATAFASWVFKIDQDADVV